MAENTQSNKVYEYILQKIKANKWTTGERIYSEKELCEKLEVSRIAVRAALDKLSALGILEKRKGAGSYISEIDIRNIVSNIVPLMTLKPMDIFDVLRFRLYFESANVAEFMKNHDPEDVEDLKATYEQMKLHIDGNEDFYLADLEFHKIIARGTKNPIVISISEMLTDILAASEGLSYNEIGPEVGMRYHRKILEAIDDDDEEMATLLMTRHIEENIDLIKEKM